MPSKGDQQRPTGDDDEDDQDDDDIPVNLFCISRFLSLRFRVESRARVRSPAGRAQSEWFFNAVEIGVFIFHTHSVWAHKYSEAVSSSFGKRGYVCCQPTNSAKFYDEKVSGR